jgi:aspartyl-tRNA synthetase
MVYDQIVAESLQVLNKVGLALPFLVTLADDNKELPSEEVRLRFLPFFCSQVFA